MSSLGLLAMMAGAAIAVQAGMNARLGVLLDNALMSTAIAFTASAVLTLIVVLVSTRQYPSLEVIRAVPTHLWTGGILSSFGVALFYFLIPKMGVGNMMSFALSGQILVATLCSHLGWFDLPAKPVTHIKLIGLLCMIAGIVLVNLDLES
jgi:transporter family-2 protein